MARSDAPNGVDDARNEEAQPKYNLKSEVSLRGGSCVADVAAVRANEVFRHCAPPRWSVVCEA